MKELELVEYIRKHAGKSGKGVKIGIGDDCAVLDLDKERYHLWAADMLVEGTHFDVSKTSYKRIGYKAVAVNISDIASMGGKPKYISVSIGVPRGKGSKAVKGIYKGIFEICKKYNIKVIGGDTSRSKVIIIDVSIIGVVDKKKLVTRSGAKEKDLIIVTGPVRNGKKDHLNFVPRLKEAQSLIKKYNVSSMIDVSDGIAVDLFRICDASLRGCRLYEGDIPLSKGLNLEDAMYYGESFELLFTMSKREAGKMFKTGRFRNRCFIIGEIVGIKRGRKIIAKNSRERQLRPEGYRHI